MYIVYVQVVQYNCTLMYTMNHNVLYILYFEYECKCH